MASVEEMAELRAKAFEKARALVDEWRASGRHTTTAGVTSALGKAGVLDLPALGMSSNRDFWDQAVASGHLMREQQPNGHWLLLLPGEHREDVAPQPSSSMSASAVEADMRLKSDVWTSFVDWNPAYRRFWDRDHARAFMIPVAPGWEPEDVDLRRFVEIVPAGQEVQIGWMRTFAATCGETDRAGLLAALADDAPRGAFRRELRARDLQRAWRIVLRDHIVDAAVAWARAASVDVPSIMENRSRDVGGAETVAHPRSGAQRVSARSMTSVPNRRPSGEPEPDRTTLLRERLHRVIDAMTWDELARIEIRAEHLTSF